MSSPTGMTVMSLRDLTVKYKTRSREITALHHVNLDIRKSEIIAVVGESGCGKSTLGLSIIQLLPIPPAKFEGGQILYNGSNLLESDRSELIKLRGTTIAMIFQEPMTSLDPSYMVGDQLSEAIRIRKGRAAQKDSQPFSNQASKRSSPNIVSRMTGGNLLARRSSFKRNLETYAEALQALKKVQIADAEGVLYKYPHELSGGMAQRVMIAQALLEKPTLLIADEPTSALDVTTQAQVLSLIRNLRDEIGASVLFITHDLAVAAQIGDRVVVMYAGEIVEDATTVDLFKKPLHPYTEGLMRSFPRKFKGEGRLEAIGGEIPNLRSIPDGCIFHPRCPYVFQRCVNERPPMFEAGPNHGARCFLRE